MVSLLPENVIFEAGLEQEGSVVAHYRTFALADNYQLIQKRREHAGDRSVESMELVEKDEGMKLAVLVLTRKQDSSGAQHTTISQQNNKRLHKKVKQK